MGKWVLENVSENDKKSIKRNERNLKTQHLCGENGTNGVENNGRKDSAFRRSK